MSEPIQAIRKIVEIANSLGEPEIVAELFCELDDDGQSRFFSRVAAIMESWNDDPRSMGASWQIDAIASHMNACSCGTDGKRWVERLHESLQLPSSHAQIEARS